MNLTFPIYYCYEDDQLYLGIHTPGRTELMLERHGTVYFFPLYVVSGFLFGIGLILAAAFMRVALHMNLIN